MENDFLIQDFSNQHAVAVLNLGRLSEINGKAAMLL